MDIKSPAERSANMRRIRRRDGKAELALRKALFRLGGRYRVDDSSLMGHPDICFRRARVAVFIDSAFWHGQLPKKRVALMKPYWREKLERNRRRDRAVNRRLTSEGWLVLRVPERAVLRQADDVAFSIVEIVKKRPGSIARVRLHPDLRVFA